MYYGNWKWTEHQAQMLCRLISKYYSTELPGGKHGISSWQN